MEENPYIHPIPDYADVMTVKEFKDCCAVAGFTDDDGYGEPVRNGKISCAMYVRPSRIADIPESATHVAWFNK